MWTTSNKTMMSSKHINDSSYCQHFPSQHISECAVFSRPTGHGLQAAMASKVWPWMAPLDARSSRTPTVRPKEKHKARPSESLTWRMMTEARWKSANWWNCLGIELEIHLIQAPTIPITSGELDDVEFHPGCPVPVMLLAKSNILHILQILQDCICKHRRY